MAVESRREPVLLPVAQMRDSHDLVLDPGNVVETTAQVVVPPYLAMRPDDVVTLTFVGYLDGEELDRWLQEKPVTSADIGKPLVWKVPREEVDWIEGGYAEVSYRVDYASGDQGSLSALQTFQIGPETSPRQSAPWIHGYEGDENLDPGAFPNGLYLRVEPWPGMAVDDQLLLYWIGERDPGSVIKSLRIDASAVDSGIVETWIEPQWLHANIGGEVRVLHQFARTGRSLSGETLALNIRPPLDLQPPIVANATAEGGSGENKGVLDANKALTGVVVDVPQGVPLGPDDELELHWAGHPAGGQHIATSPVSADNPRRFRVPSTAVAANIAPDQSKRFDVFYRLTPAGQSPQDSVPFHLRILPVPSGQYPHIQCLQASGHLSLTKVPDSGADLEVGSWWYMAAGQLLTIEAHGVDDDNQDVMLIVRNAAPVSEEEFAERVATAKLSREFLVSLQLDQHFSLKVRLSYDGGQTEFQFPLVSLQLIA